MLKELLENGKLHIDHFFHHLDLEKTEKIVDALEECKGTLFFSGIGKSEAMAKKVAVTMTSTGTRGAFSWGPPTLSMAISAFFHQTMYLSFFLKEMNPRTVNLVPFIRNRGVKTIAIVSDGDSRLSRMCDMSITLPLSRELCPLI